MGDTRVGIGQNLKPIRSIKPNRITELTMRFLWIFQEIGYLHRLYV